MLKGKISGDNPEAGGLFRKAVFIPMLAVKSAN
jgi:hypothetical protein